MADRFTSPAFVTEAEKPNPQIVPVIEIEWPGETWRLAGGAVAIPERGQFEPRVKEWGPIVSGGTDRSGRLEAVEVTVTIDNVDRAFSKLRFGPNGNRLKGSPATIWFVLLDNGVFVDAWEAYIGIFRAHDFGQLDVVLTFRVDDIPLQRVVPKIAIAPYFPNAHASAAGAFAPSVYGIHDATGMASNKGAVVGLYVDTVLFRYLFSIGRLKTFRRVYSGTTLKTAGVDYTVTYLEIDGVRWAVVDFVADQGANEITADIEGIEDIGDGSGAVIENPVRQLKHRLINFHWKTYKTGNWFTDADGPIDAPAWAAAADVFDSIGYTSAVRFSGEQVKGVDLINDFADQLNVRFFWTNLGLLYAWTIDPRRVSTYGERWVRYSAGHDLGGFGVPDDPTGVIDRVPAKYCLMESNGDYVSELEVRDSSIEEESPGKLELRWSPGSLV